MGSLKVAVIGGGVAGMISARELHREGHRVTIFEKSEKLGGLWVYDPRVESDPLSHKLVHSSVYFSLRTNLPRVLMSFSDFSFEQREYGDPRDFPGHQEMVAFLNDFATRFGIHSLARFNSEVVRVERVDERVDEWVVEWRKMGEVKRGVQLEQENFHAVVVANGHCSVPRVADIPGIEKWPGKQIHSHNYRVPEPFKDEVVVIIGNGASALDISHDISKFAKEVHLSSRSPDVKFSILNHCCNNLWQHSAINMAKEDGTIDFEDGSSIVANIIMHCTGYKYELPFLKTNGIVSIDDNCVGPLYKHVFPPKLAPWLSFVGLPQKTIIFEMLELQSKWIARVLSTKVALPSKEEMMADVQEYYQQMTTLGLPKHLTHYLQNFEEYLDWLAAQVGTSSLQWRKELYKETVKRLLNNDNGYRDDPRLLNRNKLY
ncbi:flavin-containing monooxygenase FMO GS-OX5-like isoform X2 [Amaranthus tricolor]|uniref:flavin-containing monooxygenase FMO GS-OX5-like isoform X2 n=1 Tax=Amaranthus tricolor TaxID=29722 RepID=UPI0025869EAE|nr:flavin-containing monooxygenase FMO GS-OX5-like isoform X2 [Amaranthus tricolor]